MFNPEIHRRRSVRLVDYDYRSAGAYFVTLCVQNRETFFGDIRDGVWASNDAARMLADIWQEMPQRFSRVVLDDCIVMPNHFHGILILEHHKDEITHQNEFQSPRRDEPRVRPIPTQIDRRGESCIRPIPTQIDRRGESCIRPTPTQIDRRGESCIRPQSQGDHKDRENQGDHKDRPYGTLNGSVGRVIQAFKSLTTNAYIRGVKNSAWSPFPGRLWQRNYYERIIRDENELHNIRQYIQDNPAHWATDHENPSTNQ